MMTFRPDLESHGDDIPPAYGAVEAPHSGEGVGTQLHFDFSRLDLESSDSLSCPATSTCLIHLKLLYAIEIHKNKIGHQDGLWGIWDKLGINSTGDGLNSGHGNGASSKRREKRWAIYVARAVDRYEAWWKSFVPDMITELDILGTGTNEATKYEDLTMSSDAIEWNAEMIPPIGESLLLSDTVIPLISYD